MQDHRIKSKPKNECEDFDVFTIQDTRTRKVGMDKIGKCDLYTGRMYYNGYKLKVSDRFEDLRGGDGFGIVIKDKTKADYIKEFFRNTDWTNYGLKSLCRINQISKVEIVAAYNDHKGKINTS